uniref:Putative secreted protein n=1 Tax=Anopheles darlingi TaxID=43151 RepID=A0A2M4DAY8_ANODA
MLHDILFFSRWIVLAYSITGSMMRTDAVQARADTTFDTSGVRKRGDEIGWQTAMYRSADMMNRKMDEVNCVIEVDTMYALHIPLPNVHSPRYIVVMRNGIPIRKH